MCKFALLSIASLTATLVIASTSHSEVGKDWGVLGTTYNDPVTGYAIRELTSSGVASDNLYYHFSNFTADNQFVLFTSSLDGDTQLFRAQPDSGQIVQLTDGSGAGGRSACPDPTQADRVYLQRGAEILALNIRDFSLHKIGEIPPPAMGGYTQPSISGDGKWLALGKQRDAENWEIGLMSTETGAYRTVITQGFRIAHIQHSPTDPIVFYVWETGGYAPQRSWIVKTDGTGNRPFYYRTKSADWFTPLKEWVTHEAWVANTGEMTMINDKQGVMLVAKDGTARMVREGHYWHAAARPDGKALVLDDSDGRLWLMNTDTGDTRLLATGLRNTERIHPHPSFDRLGHYVFFHTGRMHETVAVLDLRQLKSW